MGLPTVTVTGTWRAADGGPARGRILFRLLAPLVDSGDNVLVPASTAVATLDAQGAIAHALVPSDAAGITPTPVAYRITEQVPGGRTYDLLIPSASPTVRLADLVPLAAVPSMTDDRAALIAIGRAAALTLALGA